MTRQQRIGVIGLGVISKFYLAALETSSSLQLAAVCDRREAALAPWRGVLPCYVSHQELLARTDVDGVIINVPNDLHAAVARDAIHTGVAVCVEKPLALQLADGRELIQLARQRGVPLLTALHRRHNAEILRLRADLATAPPVTDLTVRYLERIEDHAGADRWYLDPKRCGGGCIADNGPNAFDVVRLLIGDVHITRVDVTRDGADVDRQASIKLQSEGGVRAVVELDWSYPLGERKEVEVVLADGGRLGADMLAGHTEFKSSLWHEYVAIVKEFERAIRSGTATEDGESPGLAALALVDEAYRLEAATRISPAAAPDDDVSKRDVEGEIVKVLGHRRDDRGMVVEPFASRCVRRGEIHELVTTDQVEAIVGDRIDRVGFLGFAEIERAGVLDRGDAVRIGGRPIGRVLGFDAGHFPNHYNILIAGIRQTGRDLALAPGDAITFASGDGVL